MSRFPTELGGSFRNYEAVTPADNTVYGVSEALYVGVQGDVAVMSENGDTVVFTAAQGWLFITSIGVDATGTTATDIVRCW